MKRRNIVKLIFLYGLFFFGGVLSTYYLYPNFHPPPLPQERIIYNSNLPEAPLQDWVLKQSSRTSPKQARLIVQECVKTDLPLLLLALISVESEFNPTAISSKGAIGLGQIMFTVHERALIGAGIIKERRDLFDVEANIKATQFVLESYLKQSKGDVVKALERYLGGQDGVYQKKIFHNLTNLYILINKREKNEKTEPLS